MPNTVTITMLCADAEPFLRTAAEEAAKFGAWIDHITLKTYHAPSRGSLSLADSKVEWRRQFLRAKRIVESFGVEYELTSEEETLTVYIPSKNEKRKRVMVAGMAFTEVSGGEPDYKNPQSSYRGAVHSEACRQAADRVVRRWKGEWI